VVKKDFETVEKSKTVEELSEDKHKARK